MKTATRNTRLYVLDIGDDLFIAYIDEIPHTIRRAVSTPIRNATFPQHIFLELRRTQQDKA